MFIVTYRKIFYSFSAIVIALAVVAVSVFGLKLGIDFTGGTLMELSYAAPTEKVVVQEALGSLELGAYSLRTSGENGYILRTEMLSAENANTVAAVLGVTGAHVDRVTTVGPVIGQELRSKALWAIALVVIAIILFIAFVFRKVSEGVDAKHSVSSWHYGLIAIIALMHDILVPVGLFALLGHFFGAEVDVLFVMALLAILGYSVNDTIVVFDRVRERVRENAQAHRKEDFELTVGSALKQTYARSINTSFTTLLVLLALFFVGATVTQDFALVLIAGVLAGTYSSMCLATPLLVSMAQWRGEKGK